MVNNTTSIVNNTTNVIKTTAIDNTLQIVSTPPNLDIHFWKVAIGLFAILIIFCVAIIAAYKFVVGMYK